MIPTITVDWGEVHIVLGRSTVADARLRRQLYAAVPKERQGTDASNWTFIVTQLRECTGVALQRLSTVPDEATILASLEAFDQLDEMLMDRLADAIVNMRNDSGDGEKKVSTS